MSSDHLAEVYQDGYHGGMRTGPYEGAKTVVENPWPKGSFEHAAWDEGFGDATDALWYGDY